MNNYTVYMHVSPSNKRYIGITSQKPKQRWKNGTGYKGQVFYNAIEKYGWNNIEHIIVAQGLSEEEAKWLEIELISVWDTTNSNKGYNVTNGGDDGGHLVGEKNPMYNKHHSQETKDKISKTRTGKYTKEDNGFYGKTHSKEQKEKWSKERKGKYIGSKSPKAVKIRCIETGQIFGCAKEAGESVGVARTSITSAINRGTKTGGYHWERIS